MQSISAQNAPPPPPFGGPPPIYDRPLAAPAIPASDLEAVRDAIGFANRRRPKDATDAQQRIADPTARKLVEWVLPIRCDTRTKLVTAIARGRQWLSEIEAGTVTIDDIARSWF